MLSSNGTTVNAKCGPMNLMHFKRFQEGDKKDIKQIIKKIYTKQNNETETDERGSFE